MTKKHKWINGWVSEDLQGAECRVCGKQTIHTEEHEPEDCELGKFGIVLTEEELQECVDVIKKWTRLILTPRQLSEVLMPHGDMKRTIREFGATDTVERETLADLIVYHMGFDHWPYNMESGSEYAIYFWDNVYKKAVEYNYGVDGWISGWSIKP